MKKEKFLFEKLGILSILILFFLTIQNKKEETIKASFIQEETDILLEKGYSLTQINEMMEYLNEENLNKILESNYTDLESFYKVPNFHFELLERYKAYRNLSNKSFENVVTEVNIHLDTPFYTDIKTIQNPEEITVLVNKYHALPKDYEPKDLTEIPSFPNLKLRKEVISDFENLLANALLDQVFLIPYSTYRSYEYQEELYNGYLEKEDQDIVDTYSARPGHSEHQTGLAIDIRSNSHWNSLTPEDYEWIKNNGYKYGFILRYSKGQEQITGYKEEPWHIRYVGIEHATKIHELNITWEEYYDLYLQ